MKKSPSILGTSVLISLIVIVWNLIGNFAHLEFANWFKYASAALFIGLLIYFCIQYGKTHTEGVTFGKVFGYGFKLSMLVTLITVVFSILSVTLIFPEIKEQVIAQTRTTMEADPKYSADQVDQAVAFTRKGFMMFLVIGGIIFSLLTGVVGSLIGAALAKKSEPNVFQEKA